MNPNGIKTLLATGLSTFPIKGKPLFSNGPRSLSRNPLYCTILDNWAFDSLILANESFPNALWSFKTYVSVNNNLCGKLLSSLESPTTFDESF